MNALKTYYFRVLLPVGGIQSGLLRLAVERDHSARLRLERETEGTVLTLWHFPTWLAAGLDFLRQLGARHVSDEDMAGFLRDMGLMLAAGVSALDALRTLVEEGRATGNKAITQMATRMADDLSGGIGIAESLNRYPDIFPETVRNLVSVGDQSGSLPRMLGEAAAHVERSLGIRRDIRTALIYPLFVFATIFGVAGFWIYYVVPNIALLFKQMNAKLPPITIALVSFSDAVVNHALLVVVLLVALMSGLILAVRHVPAVRRGLHEGLHRLPIARVLITSAGMAQITEHLAILVRAGLDFVTCLKVLSRTTQDQYYQQRLVGVRESVERGTGIAASMRSVGGFPAMAVRMIAVGEESGNLDVQLTHLADEYRKRLEIVVKSLFEILKPLVVLLAGALFLFLIVALLLPVYDLVRQSMNTSLGK
jgi:general secretion pathway protein F/type IV pilus assembly protein PilC